MPETEDEMIQDDPSIADIGAKLLGAFPKLTPEERRAALALYRLLAAGKPVAVETLAESLDAGIEAVAEILSGWPGVYKDDDGRIVGFWGLALPEMGHKFKIGGKNLFTWCAWDTLFLPAILGETAEVESSPPAGGEPIRLVVSPSGIEEAPEGVVMSIRVPDKKRIEENIVANFCHYVYFFNSRSEAEKWAEGRPGMEIVSLAGGFRLGRFVLEGLYGEELAAEASKQEFPPGRPGETRNRP